MGAITSSEMVSQEFAELAARKGDRARQLAVRFPASRELLEFAARVYSIQAGIADQGLPHESISNAFPVLRELVDSHGPEVLRQAVCRIDLEELKSILDRVVDRTDTRSPASFFGRVLLQPVFFKCDPIYDGQLPKGYCPRCGHPPQFALLRTQGHGKVQSLVCSLCQHEWAASRTHCPQCRQSEQPMCYFHADEFEAISLIVCPACNSYMHCVDLGKCSDAIGDVDELAALPLDVWAQSQGYRKIQPGLAGI